MKISIFKWLILILLALVLACNNFDSNIYESGVNIELAKLRDKQINNVIYYLNFIIPSDIDTAIVGNEKIKFEFKNIDNQPLLIDFRNPESQIKGLKINGKKTSVLYYKEHIIIKNKKLKEGQNEIEIDFIAGDRALNRNQEYLYTLFVPDRACTAFPSFDQPSIKAKYKTEIEVPKDWTAISNSELLNKNGNTYIFDYTKPISTYLYSFVAGIFHSATKVYNDRKITMYHREDDPDKISRNIDKIFELKYSSLKWLEDYTQIKYPFKKLDFVVIPSFQYSGMEHPGAVLYRDSKLFLDESSTIRDELNRANLIAHETAHMWFGDLVTMNWFSQVWLKEVFANFMADKIVNPQYPEINHELNFLINHYPSSYSVDRTAGSNPIEQKLENIKNAGSLYGSIIYHKAPIVMNLLENLIGTDELKMGLQEYLSSYSYGNATWDDLISILKAKTAKNLTNWSKVWVYEPGMPTYNIERAFDVNGNFTSIIMEQKDTQNKGRQWNQSAFVIVKSPFTFQNYEIELKDTFNVIELDKKFRTPNYVFPNTTGIGYGFFKLDSTSTKEILTHISVEENPVLRCSMYISIWENMLNQNITPNSVYESFITTIHKESNAQNANLLLNYIQTLYWKFLTTNKRLQISADLESLLWKEIETQSNVSIKSSLFKAYYTITTSNNGLDNIYSIWKNESNTINVNLSENDYTNIALDIMLKAHSEYENVFITQSSRITNKEKLNRFRFIAEAIVNRDAFFESLKNEKNREKEPWVIDALNYLHHPLKNKESIQYILPSLEMLSELQRTGDIFFPKQWLDATFGGHYSVDAVTEINVFLNKNPNYSKSLKDKILQSTDLVYKASIIRNE
jgi:aminopeptidase N